MHQFLHPRDERKERTRVTPIKPEEGQYDVADFYRKYGYVTDSESSDAEKYNDPQRRLRRKPGGT